MPRPYTLILAITTSLLTAACVKPLKPASRQALGDKLVSPSVGDRYSFFSYVPVSSQSASTHGRIHAYLLDPDSASAREVAQSPFDAGVVSLSYFGIHPTAAFAYALGSLSEANTAIATPGALRAFRVSLQDGSLEPIAGSELELPPLSRLQADFHPSGRYLFVARQQLGGLAPLLLTIRINPETGVPALEPATYEVGDPYTTILQLQSSADGRRLHVLRSRLPYLRTTCLTLSVDAATGALSAMPGGEIEIGEPDQTLARNMVVDPVAGAALFHMAATNDGAISGPDTITIHAVDPVSGLLLPQARRPTLGAIEITQEPGSLWGSMEIYLGGLGIARALGLTREAKLVQLGGLEVPYSTDRMLQRLRTDYTGRFAHAIFDRPPLYEIRAFHPETGSWRVAASGGGGEGDPLGGTPGFLVVARPQ